MNYNLNENVNDFSQKSLRRNKVKLSCVTASEIITEHDQLTTEHESMNQRTNERMSE